MVLNIKRYKFTLLPKKLIAESIWGKKRYVLKFPITRWNPFSYAYPLVRILLRKFCRSFYFQRITDDGGWHLCSFCSTIGNEYVEDFPACEGCAKKYA